MKLRKANREIRNSMRPNRAMQNMNLYTSYIFLVQHSDLID